MKNFNPSAYFSKEELEIVKQASDITGLSISSFIRTSSLTNARKKIKEVESSDE